MLNSVSLVKVDEILALAYDASMSLLLPLLLLGGGVLVATQVLGKPAVGGGTGNVPPSKGPSVPADPAARKAQFDALVETMPGGANANPAYADFFARTQPADVLPPTTKLASGSKDAWAAGDDAREAAALLAVLGLTPTSEPKDGDTKLRTDLTQLGALLWQRGIDTDKTTGTLPDETRFSPSAAIVENTGWFSDMQDLAAAAVKLGTSMPPEKQRDNAHMNTMVWLKGNVKEMLLTAALLAMMPSVIGGAGKDVPAPLLATSKHLQGLYRARAVRIGGTKGDASDELAAYDKALADGDAALLDYVQKQMANLPPDSLLAGAASP